MSKHCRFCGEKNDNLSLIESLSSNIMVWLHKIINVDNDNLPNKLCYTCLCTIEDINFFIEKCKIAYSNFMNNMIKEQGQIIDETRDAVEVKDEMKEEYLIESEHSSEENDSLQTYKEPHLNECNDINNSINVSDCKVKQKKLYKCLICSQEFVTAKDKSIHVMNHMSEKIFKKYNYKCRFCNYECNDREKIAHHMKKDHFNNNKNALFKDLLAIVVDQRQICEHSEINFRIIEKNKNLDENYIEIIKTQEDECKNNDDVNDHYIKILNLADVYECKICKINFAKKTSFNKHWDALHLSDEEKELRRQKNKNRDHHLCPECGKSLPSAFKLEYHLRMHKNDRQFRCSLCPKTYVSKSHLETHMHRHTGYDSSKMYSCEMCDKKCRTPSELKIHQRFHRNERPFSCDYCQKAFYLKSHLKSHVRGHLSDRTYICNEPGCTQSYRDKNAFRRHADSHLPEEQKKYECDICNNRFSTFGIMKDHRRKSHSRKHKQIPLNEHDFFNNINVE